GSVGEVKGIFLAAFGVRFGPPTGVEQPDEMAAAEINFLFLFALDVKLVIRLIFFIDASILAPGVLPRAGMDEFAAIDIDGGEERELSFLVKDNGEMLVGEFIPLLVQERRCEFLFPRRGADVIETDRL